MEKKAQNHVAMRGNVDGNIYVFKELEAYEKKEEKNSFSTKANMFCVRALHVA